MVWSAWLTRVRAAADVVEATFGEQIDLLPWESEQSSSFTERGPDTTRAQVIGATALFHQGVGEEDKAINAMIAQAEAYYVIDSDHVEACGLTQGDRIRAVDRDNELFEVTFVGKSGVRKPRVYLYRVKDPSLS